MDLRRRGAGDTALGMAVEEQDPLTERIIGCAIEVHRTLGPGLLESAYVEALTVELAEAGLRMARQVPVPLTYKGHHLGEYRLDLLVEEAVARFDPVHEAQLLTYLRLNGQTGGSADQLQPASAARGDQAAGSGLSGSGAALI